jgi:hypothetical protein
MHDHTFYITYLSAPMTPVHAPEGAVVSYHSTIFFIRLVKN